VSGAHTPGPWRVPSAKPTKTRGVDILAGYAQAVAHVPVQPSYMSDRAHNSDANLIAAAPELLAALQALVETGTDSPQHIAAERAIAKALGETK
jgi:hypothetical protein